MRHADRHGIEVVEGPKVILVSERNVEGGAGGGDLCGRRNDGFTAADWTAHRFSEHWLKHGVTVLQVTVDADNGRLSVAHRWFREARQHLRHQLPVAVLAPFEQPIYPFPYQKKVAMPGRGMDRLRCSSC